MMHMYPLSFKEFLWAKGKQNLSVLIDEKRWDVLKVVKPQLIQALREYYYIGGMPEVVKSYLESNDLKKVREKQLDILNAYEMDISKHVSIIAKTKSTFFQNEKYIFYKRSGRQHSVARFFRLIGV